MKAAVHYADGPPRLRAELLVARRVVHVGVLEELKAGKGEMEMFLVEGLI